MNEKEVKHPSMRCLHETDSDNVECFLLEEDQAVFLHIDARICAHNLHKIIQEIGAVVVDSREAKS